MESLSTAESPHHHLWLTSTTPVTLRTVASPPIRNLEALTLTATLEEHGKNIPQSDLLTRLNTCFKAHRRTTRLLLKHARKQRRLKYGKALLRMFLKKPRVALQSILRTAAE